LALDSLALGGGEIDYSYLVASDWAGFVTGATLSADGGWAVFGGAGDAK
jgi:hypothetical protein